jgi:hypothetical protein
MVQFKSATMIVDGGVSETPNFYTSEENLNSLLKGMAKKQQDERGYFIMYFTKSTKKPYEWERLDAYSAVNPTEYQKYFEHAHNEMLKQKEVYEYTGVKLVTFSIDPLNMLTGIVYLKQYCFEIFSPKKKNYINGANASKDFLLKKGKMYSNGNTA